MAKRCRQGGADGPHGDYRAGCKLCYLARTDEKYARHWGEPWPPPKVDGAPDPPPPGERVVIPAGPDGRKSSIHGRALLPVLRSPCKWEGALLQECTSCGGDARSVFNCDHPDRDYDRCTRGNPDSGFQTCATCPDYRSDFRWVSTARLVRDAIALAGKLPPDTSGVAGVPRSGMPPAAVIAVHLHLPLWEVTEAGELRRMGSGHRGRQTPHSPPDGPLVVVDDTVHNGGTMTRLRRALADRGTPARYAAVYVRPGSERVVDFFAEPLHTPHLLEWNWANQAFAQHVAADFDGVLCHDAESGGPTGTPYMVPRVYPIPLIATGRPERHRAVTESWLAAHGVRYARLEMLPDDAEPTPANVAAHKATHYGASSASAFFVESDPTQAEIIQRLSGKPVVCPILEKVFQ